MTDKELIALIQPIADQLMRVPTLQQQHNPMVLAMQHGITEGSLSIQPGMLYGFRRATSPLIRAAAEGLRRDNPAYTFGIGIKQFRRATADAIISTFGSLPPNTAITVQLLTAVRNFIARWFAAQATTRHHSIPCAITPQVAPPFTIGPLTFEPVSTFAQRTSGGVAPTYYEVTHGQFLRTLIERNGNWVAEVDVADREESRSKVVADTAVDLGLAALKLIIPGELANACRTTGRISPAFRSDLYTNAKSVHGGGGSNHESGRTLTATDLQVQLKAFNPVLDAIGNRISTYVRGASALMALELAWCDAAYWYLEGVAEPFDTIATAKFETSIEVLMRAQSTQGSASRLRDAFWAFSDVAPTQRLGPKLPTVERLVKDIVGTRSQILHGTLSTLTHEADISRSVARDLAAQLLIAYPMELDAYLVTTSPTDNIDDFLPWIHARRHPQSAVAQPSKSKKSKKP